MQQRARNLVWRTSKRQHSKQHQEKYRRRYEEPKADTQTIRRDASTSRARPATMEQEPSKYCGLRLSYHDKTNGEGSHFIGHSNVHGWAMPEVLIMSAKGKVFIIQGSGCR